MTRTRLADSLPEDRATSPAVGAVLMVGITVVLATAAGTQVFGLAGSQQGAYATATVDYSTSEDRVTVTWLTTAGAETLKVRVQVRGERRTVELDGVGDRVVVDDTGVSVSTGSVGRFESPKIGDGDRVTVTVIAVRGGDSVVVADRSATV
ncbi:type IV pilin [Halorussus sp. AFM4]|uniref:type IV pilin n=1 Tax=Halorussus sp. AFM4 TaxID=3421651 RepID=UPI003EC0DE0E